jgi:hypothetical protein
MRGLRRRLPPKSQSRFESEAVKPLARCYLRVRPSIDFGGGALPAVLATTSVFFLQN